MSFQERRDRIKNVLTLSELIRTYGTIKSIDIVADSIKNNEQSMDVAGNSIANSLKILGISTRTTCTDDDREIHLTIQNNSRDQYVATYLNYGPTVTFNGLGVTKVALDGFNDLPALMVTIPKTNYTLCPFTKKFFPMVHSNIVQRDLLENLTSKYYSLISTINSYSFKAAALTIAIDGNRRLKDLERRGLIRQEDEDE